MAIREHLTITVEWPTFGAITLCYLVWGGAVFGGAPLVIGVPVAALALTFHASLQHEAVHGHPTGIGWLDYALVWPPLALWIPFARFRDTHLAHHRDPNLTDPHDDPESNYLSPDLWDRLPGMVRLLMRANNTLAGRMVLGPLIGLVWFWHAEARRPDLRGLWLRHALAVGLLIAVIGQAGMPLWAYLLAVYASVSILKIRSFAEHRAEARCAARSVIIEDSGPLAFLFLNNNLHVVHHAHPHVPWYRLPALYAARQDRFRAQNGSYVFASYGTLFARHFWRAKDPVPHPLMPRGPH